MPGGSHNSLGGLLSADGQAGGGGGRVPQGAGDPAEAGRRQPRRHRLPQRPGISHNNLGAVLVNTGKRAEAEAEYRKGLAIQQKLADDNPAVTWYRSRLANSHMNLGSLLVKSGKLAEAEAESRKGLAIVQKLADDHPESPDYAHMLGGTLHEPGRSRPRGETVPGGPRETSRGNRQAEEGPGRLPEEPRVQAVSGDASDLPVKSRAGPGPRR